MNLYLLRHAKTEKSATSGKDFDRKLAEKGIKQANLFSSYLKEKTIENVEVWCSTAARTRKTALLINTEKVLSKIIYKDELYLASLQELLAQIWESDSERDLFIIGHNEGLSELASYFSGKDILLQTCGFIHLQFEAQSRKEWSKDLAQIIDLYRPEIIV